MNAATPEAEIRRMFAKAHSLDIWNLLDTAPALAALDALVAENARHGDAIRDILDVCVGWTRNMTDAEKLATIEKFGREALAGSGGDTTNG